MTDTLLNASLLPRFCKCYKSEALSAMLFMLHIPSILQTYGAKEYTENDKLSDFMKLVLRELQKKKQVM